MKKDDKKNAHVPGRLARGSSDEDRYQYAKEAESAISPGRLSNEEKNRIDNLLGKYAEKTGRLDEAIDSYKKSRNEKRLIPLLEEFIQKGDLKHAEKAYQALGPQADFNVDSLIRLAELYEKEKNPNGFIGEIDILEKVGQKNPGKIVGKINKLKTAYEKAGYRKAAHALGELITTAEKAGPGKRDEYIIKNYNPRGYSHLDSKS